MKLVIQTGDGETTEYPNATGEQVADAILRTVCGEVIYDYTTDLTHSDAATVYVVRDSSLHSFAP